MHTPTEGEILAGSAAFHAHEARDAMYKVATFLVAHFWGNPRDMADGLGVLLLTWNQAFYRYGLFAFEALEACIATNLPALAEFRARDIRTFSQSDNVKVLALFAAFLDALRIRDKGPDGPASPVGVAKALHLLAPSFFALWDLEIARAYGCNYSSKPGEKYLRFMALTKSIAASLSGTWPDPSLNKTALKVIDEYNYSKFTKHWIT
jgi:hypothetical protein